MNDKFYQIFILMNGSIRLILFVCKFDHRFLLSNIFFEVVLLLCDSMYIIYLYIYIHIYNLYNADEYSWVKVYCARWDYIFDTNKICSYRLPTHSHDAQRKFFWWSLLKIKIEILVECAILWPATQWKDNP